mgnify:CR=1 FL=1
MIRILLVALLLVGCGEKERVGKMDAEWNKAEMIDVKYYKSNTDPRYLQTFEMDGYKFVIFYNYHGSAMQAIPLNNNEEYIRSLEKENELLGSKLAEYSLDYE